MRLTLPVRSALKRTVVCEYGSHIHASSSGLPQRTDSIVSKRTLLLTFIIQTDEDRVDALERSRVCPKDCTSTDVDLDEKLLLGLLAIAATHSPFSEKAQP